MNPILVITSTELNKGILILIYATDSHFFGCLKTLHLAKTIGGQPCFLC